MTAPRYDTGGQAITGWAIETTPNTPVAAAHTLPVMPGAGDGNVDWGLTPVEIAAGSVFGVAAQVQSNGRGTWTAAYPLYPTLGADFIAACGWTSGGLVVPQAFSLTISTKAKALRYSGCHCNSIRLNSGTGNNGIAMITLSGIVAGGEDEQPPLAVPSITAEDPFLHLDLQDATLLSGAVTAHDLRDVQIDIMLAHAAERGNLSLLPNIVALDNIQVKGSIAVYFSDTNFAELDAAKAGTPGPLSFVWTKAGAGGGTKTAAIAHTKYHGGRLQRPKGGLDMLTLAFSAFSGTLDPASVTLT